MKKLMMSALLAVTLGLTNSASGALLKAQGTMTLDFVSPTINAQTVDALAVLFPGSIAFSYIFDADESSADSDPDPSAGLFPLSISNLQLVFGGYDFALIDNPCFNPAIDCKASTNHFFGTTIGFVLSQITQSAALANDLVDLTAFVPQLLTPANVNGSFSLAHSSTDDPNIFPDLRSGVNTAGFSLFLSPLFGSGTNTDNRVNFISRDVVVTDFRAVSPVPAPNSLLLVVLALGLIVSLAKRQT
jgi:hypothetical protein